jgi:hypothetical protein
MVQHFLTADLFSSNTGFYKDQQYLYLIIVKNWVPTRSYSVDRKPSRFKNHPMKFNHSTLMFVPCTHSYYAFWQVHHLNNPSQRSASSLLLIKMTGHRWISNWIFLPPHPRIESFFLIIILLPVIASSTSSVSNYVENRGRKNRLKLRERQRDREDGRCFKVLSTLFSSFISFHSMKYNLFVCVCENSGCCNND